MSNQLQITGGGKVRNLEGVITGTSGVLSSVPLGAANGVATLDSGGKVPVSQLPSSVVTYLGTWNAATNTPTLANGTGDAGDMYICNVAGTVNFGAGPVVFVVGDWVLYGSGTWQKSSGQNGTVTSVGLSTNGGAITIGSSPVTTSGTINIGFNGTNLQYVNGAGNLTTFPTLTGYVPYTGATQDVDLGAFKLNAQSLHIKGTAGNGHLGLKHQSAAATGSANESLIYADTLGDLNWLNGNLYLSKFITSGNTAARSYTFPNANGTVALTSDLTGGTVTSVAALTIGTTGTDLSSSVANSTTTPVITLNVPTASATNRGALSSADWTTFNNKQGTITLTTTGTSGASTLVGNTLNIPNYGSALTGYVTLATTQTITGAKTFSAALSGTSATFSGNIGIGLSPIITSGGAFSQIFIGGSGQGGVLYGQNNAGSVALVANGYYNASNVLIYINSLNGVGQIYNYNGEFIFSNAPIGTSGGTVTLTPRLTIASTGVATFSSSVTATAFIPSGATVPTNGMYLSAANTLNFATNTTNRLSISSTGAATFSGNIVGDGTTNTYYQISQGNYNHRFFTRTNVGAALERFTIEGGAVSGKAYFQNTDVGIGTTSPLSSLHIEKVSQDNILAVIGQSGYEGALFLSGAGSGKDANIVVGNNRNLEFHTSTSATPVVDGTLRMTLTGTGVLTLPTTGSVEVGYSAIQGAYKLDVNGTGRFSGSINANAGLAMGGQILAFDQSGTRSWSVQATGGNLRFQSGDNLGAFSFGCNVGIGTVTPTSRLEVFGGSLATAGNGINFSSQLTTGRTGTYEASTLGSIHNFLDNSSIEVASGSTSGWVSAVSVTGNNATLFTGTVRFITQSVERMRITSGGNVLIGTTDDGGRVVSYTTTAATQFKAAGTAPAITFSNTVLSPTIGGVLGVCTAASQFFTGTASSDMVLANQFSAGDLIFGTNNLARMRVKASGVINITSIPTSSAGLVSGDIYSSAGVLMIV